MNTQHAERLTEFCFAAFPNSRPGPQNIATYAHTLRRMDYETAREALEQVIDQPGRTFVPTIGEIREAYDALRRRRPPEDHPALPTGNPRLPATPDQAWTIEGATWAAARARGEEALLDGWNEADLAEHEGEAERTHRARGSTPAERAASVRRDYAALLGRLRSEPPTEKESA